MNDSTEKTIEPRRGFLRRMIAVVPASSLAAGAAVTQVACTDGNTPISAAHAAGAPAKYSPSYLNDAEWAFVTAAVDILIPKDEIGPGAVEAGVPEFIDRQLEMPWGHGKLWYMQGPFHPEVVPQLGYQHNMTPRDMYRHGVADCDAWCKANRDGKTFAELDKKQQDEILHLLDEGKIDLPNIPAKLFFNQVLANAREGFLADPIYGGNKGMVGWKMIGFPGARADFMDWIDQPNKPYPFPPVSINGERG
ncbi:gluconate 2-dehydrogenase subunit 3 family protein [Diaphorobacter sp. HDW4B]|uniref:gluconate 2-dehydrogenase subunit 3 family protein n=1 Tax=Diaphorobacter sp. HDW4B TaxID=2714925 RepID=UPI0014081A06|nr:gluconate 2-dehydrogenase subunit 3 family protein [Diaphorobacter sp. HDW4B]QIL72811.1 gluconate 2-dehydrogenase subunit 3 family protein [Diaphorobacter sp. HDW4B]